MDAFFRDRTVLVQGATGALGGAVLTQLAQRGAKIAVVVRRRWQVEKLELTLAGLGVPRLRQLVGVVDAEDAEAAAGFLKGAEDSLGPVVAFVSTAGAFASAPLGEEPNATAAELWRANFASVHTLARAVVTPMRRRRAGSMVFTGAAVALRPAASGLALYAASKAALHAYAEGLASELAPAGIRVAVVAPSTLDSPDNRSAMPGADRRGWQPLEVVAQRLLARAAEPGGPVIEALA